MKETFQNAFLGALVADAVAMPVHWYYNTEALDRDYGRLTGYVAPKDTHPDSILWRSQYEPRNEIGDILHDQAKYWGVRDIHYHQFLPAGGNTVNYLLAALLYRSTVGDGFYDADIWLDAYITAMQTPGWHNDTYLEEYHRAFFDRLAMGMKPRACAIDDLHIGGLASVPALIAALDAICERSLEDDLATVREHVSLTHLNPHVDACALALTNMLHAIDSGCGVRDAIREHAKPWLGFAKFENIAQLPDRDIVGKVLSTACYLPESFVASLCLCWKYANDFDGGILANAHCGGDSCHRGAVVGSILAAGNGIDPHWLQGLKSMDGLGYETLPGTV
jgi:ADP-ribosyl-[dinitrogen reductase] hydrolase